MGTVHLFIDFDGVLRRKSADRSRLEAHCVGQLEECVLKYSNVHVVVASTWRHALTLKQLKALFSPRFAERIVGVTPDLSGEDEEYERHAEILAYLQQQNLAGSSWAALDDDPLLFAPGAPLIEVDPDSGFDARCAKELCDRLASFQLAQV